MSRPALVIANPAARNGSALRRFRRVEEELRRILGPLDVESTRGPGDAARLAREGVRAGVEQIIVAGGDGTAGAVAAGLLEADLGDYARVGFLPLGTGGDLVRSLGLPRDMSGMIRALAEGRTRRIDAGRLRYTTRRGDEANYHFLNVASFGISGLVDELVSHTPRWFGGRIAFGLATVRALFRYRNRTATLTLDGREIYQGPFVLAAAANGQYFGGGMHVAPEAAIDDGQLDVVIVEALSKGRLLTRLPTLYKGTHLEQEGVSHHRGNLLEAHAEPGTIWLDIDGEPLGTLPATIEVLPDALTVCTA